MCTRHSSQHNYNGDSSDYHMLTYLSHCYYSRMVDVAAGGDLENVSLEIEAMVRFSKLPFNKKRKKSMSG